MEFSKSDAVGFSESDADDVKERTKKQTETQSGDPRMMDGVLRCVEQRAKILGLHAPEKHQNITPPPIVQVLIENHEQHLDFQRFRDSVVGGD